ncbi:MAG: chromosome segregation protein SMC [Lachnospiraceae bacterium]|nr:chromosome segregation protein SMC [Lachnospiraceae bacterium]
MYLKSIEVQGFKSFANKINFEFHNGITGIVGPNGSGKSNVADAVRWVLGEQRIKQLRGGKMEDVIFAGTENRKPLGFAYVAITLENSDHQLPIDFDEVTVSRRLYRSGESEYMINGSICRLKDINELFYDTGIGKEGYSIIGQGQIEKILSGKAEERRELFDEAAGIVKFKRRKIEAVKKLENEKANLARVIDILTELERQIKPLERQSETARKYLKLKDELKVFDINVFLLEIKNIKEQLTDVDDKLTIATEQLNTNQTSLEEIKEAYEKLDIYIDELNSKIEAKRMGLNNANVMREKLDGDIKVLNEQINSAKVNDEHYKERIASINASIEEKEEEKTEFINQEKDIKELLGNAAKIKAEADEKVFVITDRINSLLNQIENDKAEIINLLNDKSNVQAKIQRYDAMLEQINIRKAELNQRLLKFQNDKNEHNKVIEELNNELEKINDEIIANNNELNKFNKRLEEITGDSKSLNKQKDDMQREYHQTNSNLEALKNMTERYEGYGNSIRKIMELKETKKGIIGVVADIIQVDKKYEVAVETALGGNIQNVVTDNETTAKETIEYLKKGKFGRATFLPLSSIANKTGFTNDKVLSEKGVMGLACDLVKIKKEYENIAKYLLGRVVVVDSIENALVLARKFNYSLRMVTLEGELLSPGGSMSGGAFKNSSNLLGRRREIDELTGRLAEITKKAKEVTEKLSEYEKETLGINDEIEKIKQVLNEQYLIQNTVKMNLNKANEKISELDNTFADVTKENSEIAGQITDIKNNYDTLNAELGHWEEKNKALEEHISELNKEVEKEKQAEEKEKGNNEELRLKLSSLNQKRDFVKENVARIDGEIARFNEELVTLNEFAGRSKEEIEYKINDISNIETALANANKEIEALNKEITDLISEKENQSKEHKDFFAKREEISNVISELDKEIFRLNAKREKLEETNEKSVNYMWDEYEITYSVALEQRNEEMNNLPEMKKNISALKQEIKALGNVNVNAIEEYKEASERYTFLKTQHDDLVTAEQSLVKIIEELDEGMKKQFSEKFAQIRVEFDKVFKELFGGGKGTLELNEDEDILEAGISIISQPPGKKLQNMMQLSGGEKALTAIALLFAIQNLKPSPFCLLDEIEAALDDSNVVRFAGYLHKLTDHTQFIVITHRRGTMNASDRLYGITMQEKGISTLVSVNLIEAELEKAEKMINSIN